MTSGLTGILHASFEMVHRLETAGHQVSYACPHEVGDKVGAQGISYFQLPKVSFEPAPPLPESMAQHGKWKRTLYKLRNSKQRQSAAIQSLNMETFINLLEEQAPDLLLIDIELHDHIITAVAKGWPTVLISQWFASWEKAGLPAISSTVVPGQSWRGYSLPIRLSWLKQNIRQTIANQKEKCLSGFTDRRTVLKAWAQEVGFPMKHLKDVYWPPPLTYHGLPIWHMVAEQLEFPYLHAPEQAYLGPMVAANRKPLQKDPSIVQQLQIVFERKRTERRSLIYCSVSSMDEGDLSFIQRIIAAIGQHKQYLLVIGLGGQMKAHKLGKMPANVYAFYWVPQLQVLEQADASINHAGIHTINECIHFAVPMLVYSGKRYDQNGCAARIHFHQIGIIGDKDLDDSTVIQQKLNALLQEPTYRKKIQALQKEYLQGKNKLPQLVDTYLSTKPSPHQTTTTTSL